MTNETLLKDLPGWVSPQVRNYIAHTVSGRSIRALARADAVHPSTVSRQVRRWEMRRDDPLVDDGLRALSGPNAAGDEPPGVSTERLSKEAVPVLRALCVPGAILAVARDYDMAVVVRDGVTEPASGPCVVARDVAQAMALQGWIVAADPAMRILRYSVTVDGRAALRRLVAQGENRAQGFHDGAPVRGETSRFYELSPARTPGRVTPPDTPLTLLGRRREKDGTRFLSPQMIRAGERIHDDAVLSYLGDALADDWDAVLGEAPKPGTAEATVEARARLHTALTALGKGLAEVVVHCCCLGRGLEQTEKEFGWSARSMKIVLRIALDRLADHYAELGRYGPRIG